VQPTIIKTTEPEMGDIDHYHQEILNATLAGDDTRLKDILDELDRLKASSMKKEVLNMGM
jgi:hypothetical protein